MTSPKLPIWRQPWIFLLVPLASLLSFFFYVRAGEAPDEHTNNQDTKTQTANVSMDTTTKTPVKLSPEELRKKLTPEQFRVTQQEGTEPPFRNAYWDNHEAGLYVDVVSGEPLFSSADKFESGTGWPSFTKPIKAENVLEHTDSTFGMRRTEVRSKEGNCHLGHVFDDGPAPTGMRYCMNSASLRFIPVNRLEAEGYGQYLPVFAKK